MRMIETGPRSSVVTTLIASLPSQLIRGVQCAGDCHACPGLACRQRPQQAAPNGGIAAMKQFVSICEVGPRDGLQIAKTRMTTEAKIRWIAAIAAAGVKEIEV